MTQGARFCTASKGTGGWGGKWTTQVVVGRGGTGRQGALRGKDGQKGVACTGDRPTAAKKGRLQPAGRSRHSKGRHSWGRRLRQVKHGARLCSACRPTSFPCQTAPRL